MKTTETTCVVGESDVEKVELFRTVPLPYALTSPAGLSGTLSFYILKGRYLASPFILTPTSGAYSHSTKRSKIHDPELSHFLSNSFARSVLIEDREHPLSLLPRERV